MADITINARDGGTFSGYLATPASGTGPGIALIQEIFGVNKVMRDLADGFAGEGYSVLCPDLFWRQEPGVQLTDQTEEGWQQAFKFYQGFDVDAGVDDIGAAIAHLRNHDSCKGKIGAVGYCLGGRLAYLTAARTDVDCSVSYYGVAIDENLGEASKISKPLMMHIAGQDQFVPEEAQAKLHAALDAHPQITIHDYPGVDHAFARIGGEHYDRNAADQANGRTSAFFKEHLG